MTSASALLLLDSQTQALMTEYDIAQAERFASGVPFARFARIANKEIRHKL